MMVTYGFIRIDEVSVLLVECQSGFAPILEAQ